MGVYLHDLLAFNRGLVSPLALARLDLKRLALSADTYVNWMPRVLGSMMLRPGLQYVGASLGNAPAKMMPFVFATSDTALIELTDSSMRVRVNDVVVTSPAVTSAFNDWNGSAYVAGSSAASTFANTTDLNKWHQNDDAGATSSLAAGGGLALLGTGTARAIRDRSITVSGTNIGMEHRITIVVARGIVALRIGTSEGDDGLLSDRTLRSGTHSIAITPSATFYLRLSSPNPYTSVVSSVTIVQAGGDMVLPTPWTAANLGLARWDQAQSGDVMFIACNGVAQKRIERQDRTGSPASRSWSVVDYLPGDGPFLPLNTGPVQLQASALSGDVTLQSSIPFFKPSHVGALFRLTSAGQDVKQQITGANVFTNPIKVTGVGTTRALQLTLTATPTFTNTTKVTVQRSIGSPGSWQDVSTWTAPTNTSINDGLDNQIIWYRVGVKAGDFTVGDNLTAELTFSAGSINGIARVTQFTDSTHVQAAVLQPFGAANTYTQNWYEGVWSPRQGYPSGVAIFDGRMWWAGRGGAWGSIANTLDSFDDTVQGDSGTIYRAIGTGPVDVVNWLLPLNYLLLGAEGEVFVAKSSSIDQPLTPTAFSLKSVSGVGTCGVPPLKVDTNGIHVGRNGSRVYQLSADANLYSIVPYAPVDLTELVPEIGVPAFNRAAVQRNKDTRLHFVRSDGQVAVCVFDNPEKVTCWLMVQTAGSVEDVAVLPGAPGSPLEDQVYYVVNRTINGQTVRYLEKWALESQAVGAVDNRQGDAGLAKSGVSGLVMTGYTHLIGRQVVVWQDGRCPMATDANGRLQPKLYTVSNTGTITLDTAVTSQFYAGLPYTAPWRSAKLAVGSQAQMPLAQYKTIDHLAPVLANVHYQGLKYGPDFQHLDSLPLMEGGALTPADTVWASYDAPSFEVDRIWGTDARLCLQAQAPLPCTVLGLAIAGEGHDKV